MESNSTTVAIRGDNKSLQSALGESEKLVGTFASGIKMALGGAVAGLAVGGLASILSSWVGDASKAERAVAKLEAQIEATGGVSGYTADQLAEMADDLEKLTGIEAEAIEQGQAMLLTFDNVRGDEFHRATVAAADLAAVLGTDVSGAARLLGKSLDDPVEGLMALKKAGVNFTAEQESMVKKMLIANDVVGAQQVLLDALESKVGGTAEALGQTFSGKLDILGAKFGDLGETIGTALIPYIEAILPAAELVIAGVQEVLNIIGEMAGVQGPQQLATLVETSSKYIVETFVDSFTFIIAFFETWGMRAEKVVLNVLLGITTFTENIKYLFVDVIPSYLIHFATNFTDILENVRDFTATIFKNMWDNISSFFTSLTSYLSGGSASFEFKSLTDGFESSLKQLPEIAARQMSETEKFLSESIKGVDDRVNETFSRREQQGKAFVDKLFNKDKETKKKFETTEKADRRASKEAEKAAEKDKEKEKSTVGQFVGLEELTKKIAEGAAAVQAIPSANVDQLGAAVNPAGPKAESTSDVLKSILDVITGVRSGTDKTVEAIKNLNVGLA